MDSFGLIKGSFLKKKKNLPWLRNATRLNPYLEILLIRLKHTIKPRKKLLGAVIRVQNNRHIVVLSHQPHVLGSSNGTKNGRLLVCVLNPLSSQESSSSVGELDNNGRVNVPGCLENSVDGGGGGAIER